ncbi:Lipoxygenase isoform 2 [Hibiscus syriacus]|uniref:Lipoxygenase isoform 2 n=1 Tax=Hibiscus syriacus TaxID=106335 RepID=A0A6A3BIW5_HIBSY|nr:Lipoxygenase isoform 2 [Hibiscus syriacus]
MFVENEHHRETYVDEIVINGFHNIVIVEANSPRRCRTGRPRCGTGMTMYQYLRNEYSLGLALQRWNQLASPQGTRGLEYCPSETFHGYDRGRDEEFARQKLAGLNPHSIRLVTEWPSKSKLAPKIYGLAESAITEEMINREIRGIETEKVAHTRLPRLMLPYVKNVRELNGTTSAVETSVCTFLGFDGVLALAASESSCPRSRCELSSTVVIGRLRTHCFTEPYIISTNRQLSVMNPIYRLLHPYSENVFSPNKYSIELCAIAYDLEWRFDHQALRADLISREMADEDPNASHGLRLPINDYPFANDGFLIWDALGQCVRLMSTLLPECESHRPTEDPLDEEWKLFMRIRKPHSSDASLLECKRESEAVLDGYRIIPDEEYGRGNGAIMGRRSGYKCAFENLMGD